MPTVLYCSSYVLYPCSLGVIFFWYVFVVEKKKRKKREGDVRGKKARALDAGEKLFLNVWHQ